MNERLSAVEIYEKQPYKAEINNALSAMQEYMMQELNAFKIEHVGEIQRLRFALQRFTDLKDEMCRTEAGQSQWHNLPNPVKHEIDNAKATLWPMGRKV